MIQVGGHKYDEYRSNVAKNGRSRESSHPPPLLLRSLIVLLLASTLAAIDAVIDRAGAGAGEQAILGAVGTIGAWSAWGAWNGALLRSAALSGAVASRVLAAARAVGARWRGHLQVCASGVEIGGLGGAFR